MLSVGKSFESHQVLFKGKESPLSLVTLYICQGLGRGLFFIMWSQHLELQAAFASAGGRGTGVPGKGVLRGCSSA